MDCLQFCLPLNLPRCSACSAARAAPAVSDAVHLLYLATLAALQTAFDRQGGRRRAAACRTRNHCRRRYPPSACQHPQGTQVQPPALRPAASSLFGMLPAPEVRCWAVRSVHAASCCWPSVGVDELLDVDALRGQQEEDGEHRAVPGAVDEHGRQQVAGPHVGKAQQEAKRG